MSVLNLIKDVGSAARFVLEVESQFDMCHILILN